MAMASVLYSGYDLHRKGLASASTGAPWLELPGVHRAVNIDVRTIVTIVKDILEPPKT